MKTSVADQETRRARMLEHQKSKRDDLVSKHTWLGRFTVTFKVNLARALAMGDFEEDEGEEEEEEEMDTSGGEVDLILLVNKMLLFNNFESS